jgi:hypothetical protein
MLWKMLIYPPRRFPLKDMTVAPPQTTTKMISKMTLPSSVSVSMLKRLKKKKV